jgi:hypothetical protein
VGVARDIATQGLTAHRTTLRTGELEPCGWRDDQRDCIRNRERKRPATRDGVQGSGRCQGLVWEVPNWGTFNVWRAFRWISTSATSPGTADIPRRGSENGAKDVEQRVAEGDMQHGQLAIHHQVQNEK